MQGFGPRNSRRGGRHAVEVCGHWGELLSFTGFSRSLTLALFFFFLRCDWKAAVGGRRESRPMYLNALTRCVSHFIIWCGCRWSRTYGEGGHYSVSIQMPETAGDPVCAQAVDKTPHNTYLRESDLLLGTTGRTAEPDRPDGSDSSRLWLLCLRWPEVLPHSAPTFDPFSVPTGQQKQRITQPGRPPGTPAHIDQIRPGLSWKRIKRKKKLLCLFCKRPGLVLVEDCGKHIREREGIRA